MLFSNGITGDAKVSAPPVRNPLSHYLRAMEFIITFLVPKVRVTDIFFIVKFTHSGMNFLNSCACYRHRLWRKVDRLVTVTLLVNLYQPQSPGDRVTEAGLNFWIAPMAPFCYSWKGK